MTICQVEGCTDHYGCRLQGKGLNISPRATMSRTRNWRPTRSIPPAANRQYVYEDRPGGTKMPILNPDGSQLHRRDYTERQSQIDSTIRRIRNSGTTPKD